MAEQAYLGSRGNHGDRTKCQFGLTRTGAVSYGQAVDWLTLVDSRVRENDRMPRSARFCPAGYPVHVVQRGVNRAICFTSDKDTAAYAHSLLEGAERYGVDVHAWVFMTNHVHLLATPRRESLPRWDRQPSVRQQRSSGAEPLALPRQAKPSQAKKETIDN